MIYFILGCINLIIMSFLIYDYYKKKKKQYYGVILDKNGESIDFFKINPSFLNLKKKYKKTESTYLLPENTSFVKFKNFRLYFWEFNKPEPINLIKDHDPRLYGDIFNDLLEMSKIKALNKPSNSLLDIDKKYIFIGLVVIILIVMFVGGVF